MKIGLFFGSFNPIHNGHLAIANYMIENGNIDRLWFVVSPQNPFKDKEVLLDDQLRLEMVNLAIRGEDRFLACDVEFNLPQPSYSISTLNCLKEKYPDVEFLIIMGSDNVIHLKKWKDYQQIVGEYRFLVYPRPAFDIKSLDLIGNFTLIDAPLMEISSTSIRKAIAEKQDVDQLLPAVVFDYIVRNKLYE
jgi:nicotinate-nucleotide adenylyltransferase